MSDDTKSPYFEGIFTVEPLDPLSTPEPPPGEEPVDLREDVSLMLREVVEDVENITNIDSGESNSDWIKGLSWDLPTTAKNFIDSVGGPDKWEHFQTLPAFLAMPEELKTEVESYLKDKKVAE